MKHTYFLLLIILVFYTNTLQGQIVIGSTESPTQGAILQLKNLPSSNNTLINADKGLLLPRVNLTDIDNLFPMLPAGYDKQKQDLLYAGLLVFNTNEKLANSPGKGVYVWNGVKWNNLESSYK